jgi:hypothetical protein
MGLECLFKLTMADDCFAAFQTAWKKGRFEDLTEWKVFSGATPFDFN